MVLSNGVVEIKAVDVDAKQSSRGVARGSSTEPDNGEITWFESDESVHRQDSDGKMDR